MEITLNETEYEAKFCGVYNGKPLFSCPRCSKYVHSHGIHIKCQSCGSKLYVKPVRVNINSED